MTRRILESGDASAMSTGYRISLDTYAGHFAEAMDATVFLELEEGPDLARRGDGIIAHAVAG